MKRIATPTKRIVKSIASYMRLTGAWILVTELPPDSTPPVVYELCTPDSRLQFKRMKEWGGFRVQIIRPIMGPNLITYGTEQCGMYLAESLHDGATKIYRVKKSTVETKTT